MIFEGVAEHIGVSSILGYSYGLDVPDSLKINHTYEEVLSPSCETFRHIEFDYDYDL